MRAGRSSAGLRSAGTGYRRDMSETPVDPEDVESAPEERPIADDADQRDVTLEDDPAPQEPPD